MLYIRVMDVVFSVCIVRRGVAGARAWEVIQVLYVCVHPVVVFNAAFCMT